MAMLTHASLQFWGISNSEVTWIGEAEVDDDSVTGVVEGSSYAIIHTEGMTIATRYSAAKLCKIT
jgi:hypothetical protein